MVKLELAVSRNIKAHRTKCVIWPMVYDAPSHGKLMAEKAASRWRKRTASRSSLTGGRTAMPKEMLGTQIMSGIIGAALHPEAAKAMVVGLGTGSTAGWLAAVPKIQRVDVVELEPAVLKVAENCAPINRDALHNPKLHITIGDARETLLTTREKYDIVVSEPSNPYRAGVAGLFTREYYQSID